MFNFIPERCDLCSITFRLQNTLHIRSILLCFAKCREVHRKAPSVKGVLELGPMEFMRSILTSGSSGALALSALCTLPHNVLFFVAYNNDQLNQFIFFHLLCHMDQQMKKLLLQQVCIISSIYYTIMFINILKQILSIT